MSDTPIRYEPFRSEHLDGVVSCAVELGWPSYADPVTALAAYTSPGSVTWVARREARVVGLTHLVTNGVVHAHLSLVGVLPEYRRKGAARQLILSAFEQSGAKWLDLWSEPGFEDFYRSFHHHETVGFRIYPAAARDDAERS